VAEELLDHAQVGAALEQMRREGVAEPVRVRDEPAQRARVESLPSHREEDGVVGTPRELGTTFKEIERKTVGSLLAERHRALLAALAADVDELLLEVHVLEVEADRLGAAQAGRVDQLDERAVPEAERAFAAKLLQQRIDLAGLRSRRQAARALRR